jgi:hypothetical protein
MNKHNNMPRLPSFAASNVSSCAAFLSTRPDAMDYESSRRTDESSKRKGEGSAYEETLLVPYFTSQKAPVCTCPRSQRGQQSENVGYGECCRDLKLASEKKKEQQRRGNLASHQALEPTKKPGLPGLPVFLMFSQGKQSLLSN